MAVIIQTKRGAGKPVDGTLALGELAVDLNASKLYTSTDGTNVVELVGGGGGDPGTGFVPVEGGSFTQTDSPVTFELEKPVFKEGILSEGELVLSDPNLGTVGGIDLNNRLEIKGALAGGLDVTCGSVQGSGYRLYWGEGDTHPLMEINGTTATDAAVRLRYNGNIVLNTKSDGVAVTGNLNITGGVAATTIGASNLTPVGRVLEAGAFGVVVPSSVLTTSIITTSASTQAKSGAFTAGTLGAGNLGTGNVNSSFGGLTNAAVSDSRFKNIERHEPYGVAEVKQLNPVRYSWKDSAMGTQEMSGFVAQDIQQVMPDLVVEEHHEEQGDYLGFDQQRLITVLVKSVQELTARIEELENA